MLKKKTCYKTKYQL